MPEWSVDEMRGRRREGREKEEKKNEGNINLSNSNIKGFGNWYDYSQQTSPTKSQYLPLCHWNSVFNFWKHQFAVFSFHHSHSKFLSLSDENNIRKSSQTTKFVWVPRFLITQLWVLSNMIQNCSKPNRLWVLDEFFAFQNIIFLRKHVLKCYHTPNLFF